MFTSQETKWWGGLKSNLSQTVTYRSWTMDLSFMDNFSPNFLCRRAAVSYSTQFIGNKYDIYYMYDRMSNAVISYLLKSTLYICIHCRLDILIVLVIDIVTVTRVSVYGSVLNSVVTYNIKHSRRNKQSLIHFSLPYTQKVFISTNFRHFR